MRIFARFIVHDFRNLTEIVKFYFAKCSSLYGKRLLLNKNKNYTTEYLVINKTTEFTHYMVCVCVCAYLLLCSTVKRLGSALVPLYNGHSE